MAAAQVSVHFKGLPHLMQPCLQGGQLLQRSLAHCRPGIARFRGGCCRCRVRQCGGCGVIGALLVNNALTGKRQRARRLT